MGHEDRFSQNEFIILIWSFQKGDTVLSVTLKKWISFSKMHNIPLYIATDSKALKYENKIMFSKATWKEEWLEVINYLKRKNVKNFLSLLDDFYYIKGPKKNEMNFLIELIKSKNINYLALEPHPARYNLYDYVFSKNRHMICDISVNDRYPSSLRPSIWSVELFRTTLHKSDSIWDFETKFLDQYCYQTVIENKYHLKIKHILEKGMLNYNIYILSKEERIKLLKNYSFNFFQIVLLPKIIASNILIKLSGFRLHNVFNKRSNTSL